MRIILASASPRRSDLLGQAGISFETVVSSIEEVITKTEPEEVVEELSRQKAFDVAESILEEGQDDFLVIGADTVVSIDGKILGKPKNVQNAKEMLGMLQGREHQVFTGVTFVLVQAGKRQDRTFHEETEVWFYPMSNEEIDTYAESGEPEGKAGSYGIQGAGAIYIEKIKGDYNNVVGLPLARVYQEMKKIGL